MTAPAEPKRILVRVKARGAGPPNQSHTTAVGQPPSGANLDVACDDLLGEPIDVPPIVLIEKLEELLKKGKFLLHFQSASSVAWGLNGRVLKVWHSFRCTEDGACEYVDESIWHAEAAEVWTEEELEQLKELKSKAATKLSTVGAQPTGREPGSCHRAALEAHRRATQEQQQPAPPQEPQVTPQPAVTPAAAAVVQEPVQEQLQDTEVVPPRKRRRKLPEGVLRVQALMHEVKARLYEAGAERTYKQVLEEICSGGGMQVLQRRLKGEDDLLQGFNDLAEAARVKAASSTSGEDGRQGLKAKAPAAKAPEPAPPPPPSKASLRESLLQTFRADTPDIASQLVRMMYFGTSAKASLRLSALRYARTFSSSTDGAREMFILRGLPGVDKKEWASKHLRSKVELAEDAVSAALTVHFCSVTTFEAQFRPSPSDQAAAANEARATLLMDLGVTPIYIDGVHLRLYEMAEYVRLGKEAKYSVTIIRPEEVFAAASDVDALITELETKQADGEEKDKDAIPAREELEAALHDFEPLPEDGDPLEAILAAEQPSAAGAKHPLDIDVPFASVVPKAPGVAIAKGPRPPPGPPPSRMLAKSSNTSSPGVKPAIVKRPPPDLKAGVTIAKRPAIAKPESSIPKGPPGEKATMQIAKRPPGAKPSGSIAKRPPPLKSAEIEPEVAS